MAGFWHLSHHQMRDPNGRVYAGAKAYFFSAQTLLPLTVYQDYGLGTPHPNPVPANAYGIFPPVFMDEADGFYRQRIQTSGGVLIPGTDVGTLPIVGPASGGGGGAEVPVDENALLKTGDPLWVPITGSRSGFVRMNGRTIGSATSGASERANADTESLFIYNWQNYSDAFCPVTGGRGATAAADWAANKVIALLNMRNKGPFGLDDMGNTAAGGFSGVTFAQGNATTAASIAGAARATIAKENLPNYDLDVTTTASPGGLSVNVPQSSVQQPGSSGFFGGQSAGTIQSVPANIPSLSGKAPLGGSSSPLDKLPPLMLGTWYQKL